MTELEWQLLEDRTALDRVAINGVEYATGDRVRLRPKRGGDILDMALADKVGVIESIEEDYDNNVQFGVVLDDDPGKDLGLLRQPGHRFFFTIEEVEPA